jgi:hypothetical protein
MTRISDVRTPRRAGLTSTIARKKIVWTVVLLFLVTIGSSRALLGQTEQRKFSLKAVTPKFWDVVDHIAKISTIASGFGFTESPVWDSSGFLWVSDEKLNQIYKVNATAGEKHAVLSIGDPDGNTYDREPDHSVLYITATTSIYKVHTRMPGFISYLSNDTKAVQRRK